MSFSEQIKNEILNNMQKDLKDKNKVNLEAFGELLTQANKKNDLKEDYNHFFDIAKLNESNIKYILKGVFLSSGCVVNPSLDYHLEISFKNKACTEYIYDILSLLEFTPKILKRKSSSNYVIYIKESDQIVTFLGLLEANKSVLNFEQIRVEKQVKNNINRKVNCETANLSKTIASSVTQLEAIKKIKDFGKFERLEEKLKYVANLREKYPDKSLSFIAQKTNMENKLTKSGLKHRLDKIVEIANNI
mgnify:FL=1